jgi:hypothetical protein
MKQKKNKIYSSKTHCLRDRVSDNVSVAEKAQSAVDKFLADNNLGVADIEAMLDEHMQDFPMTSQHRTKKSLDTNDVIVVIFCVKAPFLSGAL